VSTEVTHHAGAALSRLEEAHRRKPNWCEIRISLLGLSVRSGEVCVRFRRGLSCRFLRNQDS
jgi:hypothetical protein